MRRLLLNLLLFAGLTGLSGLTPPLASATPFPESYVPYSYVPTSYVPYSLYSASYPTVPNYAYNYPAFSGYAGFYNYPAVNYPAVNYPAVPNYASFYYYSGAVSPSNPITINAYVYP